VFKLMQRELAASEYPLNEEDESERRLLDEEQ
jgi:hypothetical protein